MNHLRALVIATAYIYHARGVMRILRPFCRITAKFILWPEDAVYISELHVRGQTNGVVAKIAALESPQTAINLMAVRGDVRSVRSLYKRFRRRINIDSTFAIATESNRVLVMKSLSDFINVRIFDYVLGCAARSNAIHSARYLARAGGMLAEDDLSTLQTFGYHEMFLSFPKSTKPTTESCGTNACIEWGKSKYDIVVRAIEDGAEHTSSRSSCDGVQLQSRTYLPCDARGIIPDD